MAQRFSDWIEAAVAPVNGTDTGGISTGWHDTTTNKVYELVDDANNVWLHIGSTSGGAAGGTSIDDVVFLEDSVHTSGDAGTHMLAVRNDDLASLSGTDGDYSPLQVDEDGALYVKDIGGSSTLQPTHRSPKDFTGVFASNVTITISGAPFTVEDASCFVSYIYYKPTGGNWQAPIVNGVSGASITSAAGVITVVGAGTPFAASDAYHIGIINQEKAQDVTLDVEKVIEQSPIWSRYTDPVAIVSSPQELDTTPTDAGSEQSMNGYNLLGLFFTLDIGTSTNFKIRILNKWESAGSEEYRQTSIDVGSPIVTQTSVYYNDYVVPKNEDGLYFLEIPVSNLVPYVQIQVFDEADGDGQLDKLVVTKAWSNAL